MDEAFRAHVVEEFEHRVPEAVDVGEDDRLAMVAELRPGHDLDDLLDRSDAARQRHKGVRFLEHPVFPLVHVLRHDELVEAVEGGLGRFFRDEEPRDDSGDLAAAAHGAVGDGPHDPLGSAAVDQAQACLGDRAAENLAGLDVFLSAARRRAAIDADGSNRVHPRLVRARRTAVKWLAGFLVGLRKRR